MTFLAMIFSRYRPRFVRSLIYMLQASEYNTQEFLKWYRRTSDFAHVEKRKTVVWTTKAQTLATLSWSFIVVWSLALIAYAYHAGDSVAAVVCVGVVIVLPIYFPAIFLALNFIMSLVQRPLEARRVRAAAKILAVHPALKIAIAGSYGKTTMREILKTVLAAGKTVAAPPGSYNTPLGIASFVQTLTGAEDVILFELGEYYPGDVTKLCAFVQPAIGIITGVNEAHLEKFGTLEKTTETIFELADFLGEKTLYINAENQTALAQAREYDTLFNRDYVGEWRIGGAVCDLRGISFRMVRGGEIIRAQSRLLGAHMIGPVAVAAALAHELGLSIEQIEAGIKETKAFDHRMHMTIDNTGVITIDDSYNGNPDGVAAVIAFLSSIEGHKRFYVTPGLVEMGARTEAVHREIGERLAAASIEYIVLIRNSVMPFIEAGLADAGYHGKILHYESMPEALTALVQMTASGDIVLIQNDWPDQYA